MLCLYKESTWVADCLNVFSLNPSEPGSWLCFSAGPSFAVILGTLVGDFSEPLPSRVCFFRLDSPPAVGHNWLL